MCLLLTRALLAAACLVSGLVAAATGRPMPCVLDLLNAIPASAVSAEVGARRLDVTRTLAYPPLVELERRVATLIEELEWR